MSVFDLRALQMNVESENTIEYTRDLLTEAVEFFSSQENNDLYVSMIFKDLRDNLDMCNLEEKNIFLYDTDTFRFIDIPEKYTKYTLGLFNDENHSRYSGRLVYPIRDVKGKVMGLCGWDPVDLPKYLDSKTFGYNAKNNTLYGMEELKNYYTSKDNVYITEGIVCCNYLRSKGFQALALLGSSISVYVIEILRRFEGRCILVPDNDTAGTNIIKTSKYKLPKAHCYVSLLAKDIDDTRKLNNGEYEEELLQELRSLNNPFIKTTILRVVK